jgi:hypothetical protein
VKTSCDAQINTQQQAKHSKKWLEFHSVTVLKRDDGGRKRGEKAGILG